MSAICLLCPSPAVADSLCVPCGAKLWAAKEWEKDPEGMANKRDYPPAEVLYVPQRAEALKYMRTPSAACNFLAALESCRLQREIHETQKNRGKEL
jgi:hypothetical protein